MLVIAYPGGSFDSYSASVNADPILFAGIEEFACRVDDEKQSTTPLDSPSRATKMKLVFALLMMSTLCYWAATANGQVTLAVPAGYATIQAAIAASTPGDMILVQPGVYLETIDFLGKDVVVLGVAGPEVTVIDAGFAGRVATFSSGETAGAELSGFTLRSGLAPDDDGAGVGTSRDGGGILVNLSSPTISDCIVEDCVAQDNGAGIALLGSNATIQGCRVRQCLGDKGVGFFSNNQGAIPSFPTIASSVFEENSSWGIVGASGVVHLGDGGGLFRDCVIRENSMAYGMILGGNFTGSVVRCQVVSNSFDGIQVIGSPSGQAVASLSGCLIAQNGATGIRFGPTAQPGPLSGLYHCTVADNGGDGIKLDGAYPIRNTIAWGNAGAQLRIDIAIYSFGTLQGISNSIIGGGLPGASVVSSDPLFVDTAGGDYHLTALSPAVDAGSLSFLNGLAQDLDGASRTVGAGPDIGADELPLPSLPGSGEGLSLTHLIGGAGDPLETIKGGNAGDLYSLRLSSPGGNLTGVVCGLLGELYGTLAPTPIPGFPEFRLDLGKMFVIWTSAPPGSPFPQGLPPAGVDFTFVVPSGLAGLKLREQAIAVSQMALNGFFATSDAIELHF